MAGNAATKEDKLVFYERLWAMLEDLRVGVFTVDPRRRITSFNRAAELITGYKEKDAIGKHCHQVFLSDSCRGVCKFHEGVEAEQESLSFDVDITDAQNERRIITKIVTPIYDAQHKLTGCIEIFQDHSAFEELVDRIRYGDHQLKIILDNLDIAVLTVTRGGLVTFFNTQAEMISGYSREEILGKSCTIILGEETGDQVSLLKQSIADGKSRTDKKGLLRTKDERTIPIRVNYMALLNERGRIVGGLATIQDLSLLGTGAEA